MLGDFRIKDLKLMVERCDEAIGQSPGQAELHRDRALVLTLLGDQSKACNDVDAALSLLMQSNQPVDPMLQHELQVRQAACKQSRTMAGKDWRSNVNRRGPINTSIRSALLANNPSTN